MMFTRPRVVVGSLVLAGIAALFSAKPGLHAPVLIWNASASAPIGLYLRRTAFGPRRGDLVLVRPPVALASFAAARRYLPLGVPLIKRIAALSGDTVCSRGAFVFIDGRMRLKRLRVDGRGRPLPAWSGCHHLVSGEVFLAMPDVPDSFDGRYFGVLPTATIKGRLVPLWTH